jgi:hypothetical protein
MISILLLFENNVRALSFSLCPDPEAFGLSPPGGDGWAFIPYVVDVLSPILQRSFDLMR